MKPIILASCFGVVLWLNGCKTEPQKSIPKEGTYLASLHFQGVDLPFTFEIQSEPPKFLLHNGPESFEITNFTFTKDSLIVPLHIFDTKLQASFSAKDSSYKGYWIKNYVEDYLVPFEAKWLKKEPIAAPDSMAEKTMKRYRVYFESMQEDKIVSVAEFAENAEQMSGTFLTTTGDYRFLSGYKNENGLKLYTFDGEHAFVFTGVYDAKGNINGHFYSGKTWHETWKGYPDAKATLPDAGSITHLKEGFETLTFTGRNLDGDKVGIDHKSLKGKAVVLQIMGTWCPNCMDETAFLSNWYKHKKPENLEIISLAFEKKDDFWYAKKRLQDLQSKYAIEYPLLVGGLYDKDKAAEKLPELKELVAYPTLIFMDKTHTVKHIHTGFSGPGTGEHYEKWKLEFAKHVQEIIE